MPRPCARNRAALTFAWRQIKFKPNVPRCRRTRRLHIRARSGDWTSYPLVALLEERGVRTGIDIAQFIEAGRRAEEILDQRLRSNVIRCGPVIHGESSPDKEEGRGIS